MTEYEDNTDSLVDDLPVYVPKSDRGPNYKLLDVVGRQLDRLDVDIEAVDNAMTVQHADTVDQITELAKLVDTPPRHQESRERYRSRVIAAFQAVAGKATIEHLFVALETILDIEPEQITYIERSGSNAISVGLPGRRVDQMALEPADVAAIVRSLVPAGARIDAYADGTFKFVSITDYENGNYDTRYGFDGLDADGNPKGNGGTFAQAFQ